MDDAEIEQVRRAVEVVVNGLLQRSAAPGPAFAAIAADIVAERLEMGVAMNRKAKRRVALIERRLAYIRARDGGDHDRQEAAALDWMLRVVAAAAECGCHELLIEPKEDRSDSVGHAIGHQAA